MGVGCLVTRMQEDVSSWVVRGGGWFEKSWQYRIYAVDILRVLNCSPGEIGRSVQLYVYVRGGGGGGVAFGARRSSEKKSRWSVNLRTFCA